MSRGQPPLTMLWGSVKLQETWSSSGEDAGRENKKRKKSLQGKRGSDHLRWLTGNPAKKDSEREERRKDLQMTV